VLRETLWQLRTALESERRPAFRELLEQAIALAERVVEDGALLGLAATAGFPSPPGARRRLSCLARFMVKAEHGGLVPAPRAVT
jgi:hypothetical protein